MGASRFAEVAPLSRPGPASHVPILDIVKALAFVGDLSMGQPVDHSARTAWLAAGIARSMGLGVEIESNASFVSLLRWSGCTANAPEVAELMGDDVGGRNAMLSVGLPPEFVGSLGLVARIHCDVSGEVARMLGMPTDVEIPLRCIFENADGSGRPNGLQEDEIPIEVFIAAAAGDLEIFSRVYDLERAFWLIGSRSGSRYPAAVVDAVKRHAVDWLHTMERDAACVDESLATQLLVGTAPLEIVADVIDLKLPWMTGYSRRVADVAVACGQRLGLQEDVQGRIRRAALIHGMGRASVPNAIWNDARPATESALERLRLVPYWTARAGRRIPNLRVEAELASFADERLDGSGSFRGAAGAAIGLEGRVLAAATQWVMLQTERPGRPALTADGAHGLLLGEVKLGRLDPEVVNALGGYPLRRLEENVVAVLTDREIDVLRRISLGESNKEAARTLSISPSTVRSHLESIFQKLECSTRAAATLKALTAGFL